MKNYFGFFILPAIFLLSGCGPGQTEKQQPVVAAKTDSIEILTQLIREDSNDYRLFYRRALHWMDKGDIDPALRDLMQALELNSKDPQLFLLLSDLYFALESPQNSIDALKKALELDPENQSAFLKLAEIYLLKGEYATAQQYAETVLRLNSENAEAFYLKAIARLEQGDTAGAVNNLKLSARIDTVNFMAFMQLASIYDRKEDTLAIDYYRKALKIRPADEKALFLLAASYQRHRQFEKALDTYAALTARYPNNLNAVFNSGYIYLVELEDYQAAAQEFQRVIELNPKEVRAVYNLGRAFEAMELYKEARVQYRRSLELLPNYPLAVQGLNRLDEMGK